MIINKILLREEGFKEKPYYCSNGYPTVGIGQKIGDYGDPLPKFKLPQAVAECWLNENVKTIRESLGKILTSTEARQAVLISMAYQMGVSGLLKFKNFLAAYERENWEAAAIAMMDSKWAKLDSPARAKRHRAVILSGSIQGIYE